ncbi:MAG: hypothetical protein ACRDPO_30795 [Streptosporangiaceae bacterium]
MTDGITALINSSKGRVTVEQVSFYGDHHLQLIHAVIIPIRYDSIGYSAGWPPAQFRNLPGVQWDKRVPAAGARLPPGLRLRNRRNLVIAMRPTARKGISAGVQVLYREDGRQYELRTHTKTVVVVARTAFGC